MLWESLLAALLLNLCLSKKTCLFYCNRLIAVTLENEYHYKHTSPSVSQKIAAVQSIAATEA